MDQRYRIPPLAALNAFAAFARTGGIRRAAAELRVDHAAISRHLRDLEQSLGTTLRDRATGGLTQAGHTYYTQITPHLDGLARATAEVRQQAPSLTVTCVHGFAYHWLLPRLAAFRRAHPKMEVLLRPIDASTPFHAPGIAAETHADICYVRDDATTPTPRGLCSVTIARPPVFPVVSPAGLAALGGQPDTVADLLHAPLLQEEDETEWRLWFEAQHVPAGTIPSAGRLWQAHITLAAARAGEGIALSNPFLLGDDLETGRLLRIQPARTPLEETPLGAYVLRATERGWENHALSLFRAWLLEQVTDAHLC
ncbi:LysR substrate-binding domain-containing protein [Acetobacter farinalis]|uniref:LysR substrate-binding domain-containing protein n=1 Tax=Acetobacter farinalis TaxID=1260984 RepID=A0ABT3Q885_9PROT|nr:LysR substrate-binding domain-containing protein [Acetobacter farinalis]MCX2561492.1 LysR substrate-binding domain-containing protein [Acetobacter farinalis]NHO30440.1 LysR family transcriptional regulator [Acetobacter farinalis]